MVCSSCNSPPLAEGYLKNIYCENTATYGQRLHAMLRTAGNKKRPDQSERIITLPRQNPLCRLRPIKPGSIPPKPAASSLRRH